MSTGAVLVVCTGNICRSPVGEAVLTDRLGGLGISVTSAGTHAPAGRPAAPEAIAFVERELGRPLEHTARLLDKGTAEAADLVIAMTEEHRAFIARLAPRTVKRAFTLVELDRTLASLSEGDRFASLRELALAASRLRLRAAARDGAPTDVPDPIGGPPELYESSFQQVLELSGRVADQIQRHLVIDQEPEHHE